MRWKKSLELRGIASNDSKNSITSKCGAVGFRLSFFLFVSNHSLRNRMMKIRDQRENDHGRYTEIFDEKEVIRVSA